MAQIGPPFGHPSGTKITATRWEERKFPAGKSDGLASTWPTFPYRPADQRQYQTRIAQDWAERDGVVKPGTMYYLSALPDGYKCFEMDQPAGKQVYKRLFGHPSGRFYDSIPRFETHFWWLISERKDPCECFLCGNFKAPPPAHRKLKHNRDDIGATVSLPKATVRRDGPVQVPHSIRHRSQAIQDNGSSRATSLGPLPVNRHRPTRGLAPTHPIDEEGTRSVWKAEIASIHKARESKHGVEIDITEPDSIDWLSERDIIPQYLTQLEQQHSFIPRIGESVLWCPSIPEDLSLQRDPASGHYHFYDAKDRRFVNYSPSWRGGVVTAVPSNSSSNGAVDFTDLLNLPEKKTSLNTAGFRVETMPDPNSINKSLSKQYKYLPLRNIRPLSHWQLLMSDIPQKSLHSSILYALTSMTSISMIDKWRMNGDWKDGAYISAKGIFLGSELITIGDAVRLAPEFPGTQCTDIMVVDTIRLHLEGLNEEYLELDATKLCSHSKVTLLGRAYTTKSDHAFVELMESQPANGPTSVSLEDVKSIFRTVGTALYGSWYPLHNNRQKLEVSYDQVLGRLYEAEAVRLWSGQRQRIYTSSDSATLKPDLGFDMASIMAGRRYATKVDERIPGPPISDPNEIRWLISDYRAQALDIASFNGLEVGPYFEARTPATLAAWRAHIKISNGEKVTSEELTTVVGPRRKARPNYEIQSLSAFDSSPTQGSGKRRGRPPGSRLINGKVYRAEDVADIVHTPNPKYKALGAITNDIEVQDIPSGTDHDNDDAEDEDEDDDQVGIIEIAETQTQTPHKRASQMAGAALVATDSEDLEDDDDDDDDDSNRLRAAYGDEDISINEDEEDNETVHHPYDSDQSPSQTEYLSAWKSINPHPTNLHSRPSPSATTIPRAPPMSKSQIMTSVEQGHGSTLASISRPVYDDDDDDEMTDEEGDDYNMEEWRHPRNARGGTEESSGGDYQPREG